MEAVQSLLRPGDRFWDGGAHQGYVTLLAARRVGGDRVFAFEPSAYNRWYLERHLRWNGMDGVRVLPAALGGRDGVRSFDETGSSVTFRVGAGEERVPVRSLPGLLAEGLDPPTFLKLDVEGSEAEVLEAGADLLPEDGLAFVALHSRDSWRRCSRLLVERGFRLLPSARLRSYLLRSDGAWPGDPDLVGVGPARGADVAALRALEFFPDDLRDDDGAVAAAPP